MRMGIADEVSRQLQSHKSELSAIGERMLLGRFKVESTPGVNNPDAGKMWKTREQVDAELGEIDAIFNRNFDLIDAEKVNALLGRDGYMVIDENTLILPPESEGE